MQFMLMQEQQQQMQLQQMMGLAAGWDPVTGQPIMPAVAADAAGMMHGYGGMDMAAYAAAFGAVPGSFGPAATMPDAAQGHVYPQPGAAFGQQAGMVMAMGAAGLGGMGMMGPAVMPSTLPLAAGLPMPLQGPLSMQVHAPGVANPKPPKKRQRKAQDPATTKLQQEREKQAQLWGRSTSALQGRPATQGGQGHEFQGMDGGIDGNGGGTAEDLDRWGGAPGPDSLFGKDFPPEVKPECPQCGKIFANRTTLRVHVLAVHHGVKENQCVQCGKKFAQNGNLKIHIRTVHERRRDWGCPRCAKTFTQAHMLKKHLETKHDTSVSWTCAVCETGFEDARSLRWHCMRDHSTKELARAAGGGADPPTLPHSDDEDDNGLDDAAANVVDMSELASLAIEQCWCGFTFTSKAQLEDHDREVHRTGGGGASVVLLNQPAVTPCNTAT